MRALKELTYIVSRNKVKSINVLDGQSESPSRIETFYHAIVKDQLRSDEDAQEYFFPSSDNKSSYRNLKWKLKERLINTLFFIDIKKPSYSDRQRAYYQCYKDMAAVNILLGKNARSASVDLCYKILKHATKFEFSQLCLNAYRILRLHYGSREGDLKKYYAYKELYDTYAKSCFWENKAEEMYTDLIVHYVNNKSTKEDTHKRALAYYEEIKEATTEIGSYSMNLYCSLIHLMVYSSVNDHPNIIRVCDEYIDIFQKKPFAANTPLQIYYYQKLVSYIQMRDFEAGEQTAKLCLPLLEEGSYNWFQYYGLYFMLSMYTHQYQTAYHIYKTIVGHKRFSFLPSNVKEVWKIYKAYINYLINLKEIDPGQNSDRQASKFRLGRFLNEIPIFSKDKRGMNIAILSIQVLFLIQQKKYNKAIDSLEAIEKYCARYLHKEDTIRSYYFIKMLLCIPAASFHKKGVIRKASPYLNKLKATPPADVNQMHSIEIIPYEDLWSFALKSLDDRFYNSQRLSQIMGRNTGS